MTGLNIRTLNADEIETRVNTVSDAGVSLLLYKNARVDMNILDELFGVTGWQRTHCVMGDSVYCTVSIFDKDTGEWIKKQDVGKQSFSDPEKGAASDSFKRACTNVGIGRELYTAPFIWIPSEKVNMQNTGSGKKIVRDKFFVTDIGYDERRSISRLTISNQRNEIVYSLRPKADAASADKSFKEDAKLKSKKISKVQARKLRNKLDENGIAEESVLKKHNLKSIEDMDSGLYEKAMLSMAS